VSIVTASQFTTYGPASAFADVGADVITWYLDAAERLIFSYVGSRGYEALTAADADYTLAVFKIATWDMMVGVRGVNPADPAHAALKMSRDEAVAWIKDVAKGTANISGATPTRTKTGTARVFSSSPLNDDGTRTRGW
jgi:hypothetical protein